MNIKTGSDIPEYRLVKETIKKSQHEAVLIIDEKPLISSFDKKKLEN